MADRVAYTTERTLRRIEPVVREYEGRILREPGPPPTPKGEEATPRRVILFGPLFSGPGLAAFGEEPRVGAPTRTPTEAAAAELTEDRDGVGAWIEVLGYHANDEQLAAEGPDGTSEPFGPDASAAVLRERLASVGIEASVWFGGVTHEGVLYDVGKWLIRPAPDRVADLRRLRVRGTSALSAVRIVPTYDRPTGPVRTVRSAIPTDPTYTQLTPGTVGVAERIGGRWTLTAAASHWYDGRPPVDAETLEPIA